MHPQLNYFIFLEVEESAEELVFKGLKIVALTLPRDGGKLLKEETGWSFIPWPG